MFRAIQSKIMSDLAINCQSLAANSGLRKSGHIHSSEVHAPRPPHLLSTMGVNLSADYLASVPICYNRKLFGSLWELVLSFGARISGITHPCQSTNLRNAGIKFVPLTVELFNTVVLS